MSFKRSNFPKKIFANEDLDSPFAGIGTNLAYHHRTEDPNIEDTLLSGSIEAVNRDDGRIGGLLVDWISVHYERINADRLTSIVLELNENEFKWVKIFWSANAQRLLPKDIRFKKLANLVTKGRFDFVDRNLSPGLKPLTEVYLSMKGEDERFKMTCLRVPNGAFSHRPHQIFSAEKIARQHMAFRYRVMFGPSYRADMWAALRRNPNLTPMELATKTYGSYATAHRVKKDYLVVKRDYSHRTRAA